MIEEKVLTEEKRIYVVVAETVDTSNGVIVQPCGRIAAQCAHVVSRARLELAEKTGSYDWEPITTIVLAARDTAEMEHIHHLIHKDEDEDVQGIAFYDTNSDVYGPGEVLTAICTLPIEPWKLAGITDYLPLWKHGRNA